MNRRTSVEIQAFSVDEAVRLALEELTLTRDEVEIEVLVEGSGDEDDEALVRVTARGQASQPEPRVAQSPRAGGRPGTGQRGQVGTVQNAGQPGQQGGPRPQRQVRTRPSQRGGDDRLHGRRSPDDRPSHRGSRPAAPPVDRVDAEDERVAKQVVQELLARMGLAAEVMAVDNPSAVPLDGQDPPTIFIDVVGNDLGMLIGRRGEHLSHIQYLVNLLVNRKLETWSRVIVDVEGYRSRREESLIGLAERVARQVARSKRPVALEPMPPNERRVIHLTLRSHPEVQTESSGEGHHRHITVLPRG